jgi:hypothetical protein
MKIRLLIAASLIGLPTISFATFYFLKYSCENTIQNTVLSPDGTHAAIVFERNCGATTSFSTQVSVVSASKLQFDGSGNTLVADTGSGAAPSAAYRGPEIRLKWQSEHRLLIAYYSKARLFKNESKVNGIEIVYSQFAK